MKKHHTEPQILSILREAEQGKPVPDLLRAHVISGTYTHDYKRNGTTTLFAALQLVEGRVIGQCYPRHRHQEFLRFLRRLDNEFPPGKDLHLILGNHGTHGHPRVQRWLAELDQKAVRRGSFRSVCELQGRITEFLSAWNAKPTPFVWTASVERILGKVARARQRLEQIKPGSTSPRGRRRQLPDMPS